MPNLANLPTVANISPEQENEDEKNEILDGLRNEYNALLSVKNAFGEKIVTSFDDLVKTKSDIYANIEGLTEAVGNYYAELVYEICLKEPNVGAKMPSFEKLLCIDGFVGFIKKAEARVLAYPKEEVAHE